MRPSNIILLAAVPFIVYLFFTAENYQRSLKFIAPGLLTTIVSALGAYLVAALLGLILAGLLSLKKTERTLYYYGIATLILAALSAFFFTRPKEQYALIGNLNGRVAIVKGTAQRLSDTIRFGKYEGGSGQQGTIRSVANLEKALEQYQTENGITATFIPQQAVPANSPILWEASFLANHYRVPAILFTVIAVLCLLLVLGSWQSGMHPLAIFAELYIDVVRGLPMLVIIIYIGLPLIGALKDVTNNRLNPPNLLRGMVALSIGYAAYMAEIFRAGIEAVPKGQIEASRSLGLSSWQTARYIVLPQAIKIVIPPLGNEFIALLKDTALLSLLSVRDLAQRMREFHASSFLPFAPYNTAAILYVALTLSAASLLKWLEKRTANKKR